MRIKTLRHGYASQRDSWNEFLRDSALNQALDAAYDDAPSAYTTALERHQDVIADLERVTDTASEASRDYDVTVPSVQRLNADEILRRVSAAERILETAVPSTTVNSSARLGSTYRL